MNTRLSAAIIILLMLVPASSPGETPLGTAFTYQGQLKDAGSPVDGNYNMVFQLFDAPTLGNQIGPTLTFNGAGGNPPPVSIMDGLFTVALDFSSAAFGGSKRWLSITVGGTALTPRQELTAAPNAINADKLDGLNSTAFLQSIPAPLTLSGTSSTHIIRGENASTGFLPMAIYGLCSGTSGGSTGVRGESASTNGRGVIGFATAVTGTTYGGQFESTSTSGTGVWGMASASTGATTGGKFENDSTAGTGVLGLATAGSGTNYAVYGSVSSATGYAGYFLGGRNHFAGNVGIGTTAPEEKLHVTGGTDTSPIGGGFLVLGHTNGAHLSFDSNEIMARDDEGASDLFINHEGGNVLINAGSGAGRVGIGTTTPLEELHVIGNAEITEELFVGGGVHASSLGANSMAIQLGATFNSGPSVGFAMQVFTDHPDDIGIRAYGPTNPSPVGHAAQFLGNVDVIGEVSKDGGSFKIDHPLDPANKYLKHSFVESPDMMNVYNGNVVTDERGYATVVLPDWFETLNRDFRYQLTMLDEADSETFAQAKVVRKIQGNQFTLRTSLPRCEVSWQVTGIRQDPWANANRIQVELEKSAGERGLYRHPELYGQPAGKGMYYRAEGPQTPAASTERSEGNAAAMATSSE